MVLALVSILRATTDAFVTQSQLRATVTATQRNRNQAAFVTVELSADLQMWTQPAGKNRAGRELPPIFKLNSVAFETNLRLLPGLRIISSEALGIFIEVAGDLRM